MSAPYNNKNALKWTEGKVLEALTNIEADVLSSDIFYLGTVMLKYHLSRRLWSYWKEVFGENETIMEQMLWVEGVIEARLFDAALRGDVNGGVAIFGLKCNHQWYDRPMAEPAPKPLPIRTGMVIRLVDETIVIE